MISIIVCVGGFVVVGVSSIVTAGTLVCSLGHLVAETLSTDIARVRHHAGVDAPRIQHE